VRIRELRARSWRNLEPLVLRPSPRLTVLSGNNGQGKTNIIEAVYFIATLRSFRTSYARDLVRSDDGPGGRARLAAAVEVEEIDRQIEVEVGEGSRQVVLDGKTVRGASAIFGAVSVVLFVPEDLLLPRAPPAQRRKFLDLAVFNVERSYYKEASAFQKVLKSRNVLLRAGRVAPALLETYDEELSRTGARVVMRRRALVGDLGPRMADFFKVLHGDLAVDLRYRSDARVDGAVDEGDVRAALLEGLRGGRTLDERRRFTGLGPHTDDLEIRLSGRLAREHASQGQLRSLVLALKLAELSNVAERRRDSPVLLLDDVPSELDPQRRRYLFEMIGSLSCQTIISVTDRQVVPDLAERSDFVIAEGRSSPAP
jgi:DNA replication and repair protein RecF